MSRKKAISKLSPQEKARLKNRYERMGLSVMGECVAAVKSSGWSKAGVSYKSGVSASTLRNWEERKVRRPQMATAMAILSIFGLTLEVTKK